MRQTERCSLNNERKNAGSCDERHRRYTRSHPCASVMIARHVVHRGSGSRHRAGEHLGRLLACVGCECPNTDSAKSNNPLPSSVLRRGPNTLNVEVSTTGRMHMQTNTNINAKARPSHQYTSGGLHARPACACVNHCDTCPPLHPGLTSHVFVDHCKKHKGANLPQSTHNPHAGDGKTVHVGDQAKVGVSRVIVAFARYPQGPNLMGDDAL